MFLKERSKVSKQFETYIRLSKNNHPKLNPRGPESTKKKVETLVKRFLKEKKRKFQDDSKLIPHHQRIEV